MAIDVIPSLAVGVSLAACAAVPGILLALSHRPLRITAPGRRFVVAAMVVWTLWLAAMVGLAPGPVEIATGWLLLATATLAGFTIWTLIAWGFTLSMLLAIERAGTSLGSEEWMREYTRGRPLEALARDRVGLLLRFGLASMRDDSQLFAVRRGQWFARFARGVRSVFGLSP